MNSTDKTDMVYTQLKQKFAYELAAIKWDAEWGNRQFESGSKSLVYPVQLSDRDLPEQLVHWDDWGEVRIPPLSLMRAGHEITSGFRVPPRCDATCLPHW